MIYGQGKTTVLVISDLQVPFQHKDSYRFLEAVYRDMVCDEVVCVGDEVDQHAMSRFDPHPEADGPGVELRKAIKQLKPLYEMFPNVKVCHSNHTRRMYKKAFHAGIPKAYIKDVADWMEAPEGWKWANQWEIDNVIYEHGDNAGGIYAHRNLAITNRKSTVIGHHHSHGGISFVANNDSVIYGMNTGCLIDVKSLAFEYGKGYRFKPTLGCGVVDRGTPYFIPLHTNKAGRWTGRTL